MFSADSKSEFIEFFNIWRNTLRLEKETPPFFDNPGVERRWFQSRTHFMDRSSNHLQIIPPPHPRVPSGPRRGPRGDPRGCPEGGAGAHRTHPRPRGPHVVPHTNQNQRKPRGPTSMPLANPRPGPLPPPWGTFSGNMVLWCLRFFNSQPLSKSNTSGAPHRFVPVVISEVLCKVCQEHQLGTTIVYIMIFEIAHNLFFKAVFMS